MKTQRKTIDFINAVCASKTKKLVGKERLRRMVESDSLQVAFEILRESAFGGDISLSYREYEKLIENEELLLCEFVKEYAPSDELESFCLISYDFYNALAILKSKFAKMDYKDYVQTEGLYLIEDLNNLVENGNGTVFPKELVKAVENGKVLLENGGGGMSVGALFVRAKFDFLKRITKQKYLKELLDLKIDGINLNICSGERVVGVPPPTYTVITSKPNFFIISEVFLISSQRSSTYLGIKSAARSILCETKEQ